MAAKQTGKVPEQLIDHICPPLTAYIWEWFCQLSSARGNSGFGLNPISYSEMLAWSEITGNDLTSFEARAIKLLDNLLIGQNND